VCLRTNQPTLVIFVISSKHWLTTFRKSKQSLQKKVINFPNSKTTFLVTICKGSDHRIRGQFHQHSMGSFAANSFMPKLLVNGVQLYGAKLGAEYHKFGMPTDISYAFQWLVK
jgi:hypothetical protein